MSADDAVVSGELTRLLGAARDGDGAALDRGFPLVYDDLRRLARREVEREHEARTLRPTDLVHEAYLKLAAAGSFPAENRAHFLALAARAMRQILIDHARNRRAAKRGGGWYRATLSDGDWVLDAAPDELLALNDALERLDPRQRRVVECRFFGGMSETEVAEALGITERTVRRDWVKARAWLYRALYGERDGLPLADGAAEAKP